MRCALVHDWLTGMRGGEKVLEVLCELFPQSDLYTLIYQPGRLTPLIENRRIIPSWLNRFPHVGAYYRNLLPLMPAAAQSLKVSGYDLVVATSHCVAHGVDASGSARFVCYCFTPMRYAWDMLGAYFARTRKIDPKQWLLRRLAGRLRRWDRRAAQRVHEYVADCRNIRDRIMRCYGRESAVIYPPVDTNFYRPLDVKPGNFYLWGGALAPYKRIDLAIEAFAGLDRELVVIGEGQDLPWARKAAPANVKFLGRCSDDVLRRHYAACSALIFPGEEDFGIVPLEAQACGRPVIAYGRGGVIETVVDLDAAGPDSAPTGVFFPEATAESLREAVRRFEENEERFRPEAVRANALRFSRERCKAALEEYLLGGNSP